MTQESMIGCNTSKEDILRNVSANTTRDLPVLAVASPNNMSLAIVGGGPSLLKFLPIIKRMSWDERANIICVNGSGTALRRWDHTLKIDGVVLADARPEMVSFVDRKLDAVHFVASQCATRVFRELAGKEIIMWHAGYDDDVHDAVRKRMKPSVPYTIVQGAGSGGAKAFAVGWCLGYRDIHMFGFDSCFVGDEHHAYKQPFDDENVHEVKVVEMSGRQWKTTPWMWEQAVNFCKHAWQFGDVKITFHGDGMLPHLWRTKMEEKEAA